VVNASLSSFVIDVKVLQVIVKVDTSSTEIPAKESSVSGEDGRDINMTLSAQGNSQPGLPLVEMGNDGLFGLAGRELVCQMPASTPIIASHLAKEPSDNVSKNNGFVSLVVIGR